MTLLSDQVATGNESIIAALYNISAIVQKLANERQNDEDLKYATTNRQTETQSGQCEGQLRYEHNDKSTDDYPERKFVLRPGRLFITV